MKKKYPEIVITEEIFINAPAQIAYQFIVDVPQRHQWVPGMSKPEFISPLTRSSANVKLKCQLNYSLFSYNCLVEVIDFNFIDSVTTKSVLTSKAIPTNKLTITTVETVTPTESGCKFIYKNTFHAKDNLLSYILTKVYSLLAQHMIVEHTISLKKISEESIAN